MQSVYKPLQWCKDLSTKRIPFKNCRKLGMTTVCGYCFSNIQYNALYFQGKSLPNSIVFTQVEKHCDNTARCQYAEIRPALLTVTRNLSSTEGKTPRPTHHYNILHPEFEVDRTRVVKALRA